MRERNVLAFLASAVIGVALCGGCGRNDNNGKATGVDGTGAELTGDPRESTGAGGQGSGPTGTQGSEPADNPAADGSNNE